VQGFQEGRRARTAGATCEDPRRLGPDTQLFDMDKGASDGRPTWADPAAHAKGYAAGDGGNPEVPRKSTVMNVWDFIGDSDNESDTGSTCSSPDFGGSKDALGLPGDIDFSYTVPSELFEEPCKALSCSGGTAAFFRVCYRAGQEPEGKFSSHYVGKDLAHASDEIEFYDNLRAAMDTDSRYATFAEVTMECPGVCKLICKDPKETAMQVRYLLLLENLWNGYDEMRLVDVKMGAETSVACWKGKSRLHAWKNASIDKRTNSVVEGFRLEGMECPPRNIAARMEMVNEGSSRMRSKIISGKAAKRFLLQRLRAHEFLGAWADVSALGAGAEYHAHGAVWAATEQVGKLLRVALELPVPQMWIGSSIAMGLEVGKIDINPRVVVKVFDWGRAELHSVAQHAALTAEQKKERWKYWRQYLRSICRFYWELCRITAHRCCCCAWTAFVFEMRIEPVSIARAFLTNSEQRSEVRGVGLFQLPPEGIKGGSASVVLPLVAPKGVVTASKNMVAALHIHISAKTGGPPGEGSVIIEVKGATQLPADLDTTGAAITVIRCIGFERVGDARMHCEKFRGGHPEPTPRGRAYAMNTMPGKVVAGTMVWEANFEYVGLGEDAGAAKRRLRESLPELLCRPGSAPGSSAPSPSASPQVSPQSEPDVRDHSPWPEMLPPTVGDQRHSESEHQVFTRHLVPWLDDSCDPPSHMSQSSSPKKSATR